MIFIICVLIYLLCVIINYVLLKINHLMQNNKVLGYFIIFILLSPLTMPYLLSHTLCVKAADKEETEDLLAIVREAIAEAGYKFATEDDLNRAINYIASEGHKYDSLESAFKDLEDKGIITETKNGYIFIK